MRPGVVCGKIAVAGGSRLRRVLVGLALVVSLPLGATAVTAGPAAAAFDPAGFDFWVDSGMGPIKSRIFRAADGNTRRVVYALDGLRARNDLSGWEIDTDVERALTQANINVVMPIGGQSSFYSDWNAPSSFLALPPLGAPVSGSGGTQVLSGGPGKSVRYQWETFLTRDLRNALHDRLGFSPEGNAVIGLSMGGGAALTLAAHHPDQFRYAASYSGYLNPTGPGMPEALRVAMVDAGGFNIDAMWGPPWDPRWQRHDPTASAQLLREHGTRLWISSGNGIPGPRDPLRNAVDAYHLTNAAVLEALALANTRTFQARWDSLGGGNAVFDYTPIGVHFWRYWVDQVYKMLPDLSANLG
ncbi:esterase family protein [Nocardia sp. CDC159]|uniref:Esterase family protein n=1 Tax=Nocardia pulmonis TaxID=2951408 RepID=A0A9X2EAN2_9NOCA|nr:MULTISPECIES: alpha/beta hydrolase family protein [Nocardia]MCM6776854.1 esterase family protein [Nocardia pulmonis]MCM6789278.1 esterase family protein [Nocardia sp. CDC159]